MVSIRGTPPRLFIFFARVVPKTNSEKLIKLPKRVVIYWKIVLCVVFIHLKLLKLRFIFSLRRIRCTNWNHMNFYLGHPLARWLCSFDVSAVHRWNECIYRNPFVGRWIWVEYKLLTLWVWLCPVRLYCILSHRFTTSIAIETEEKDVAACLRVLFVLKSKT